MLRYQWAILALMPLRPALSIAFKHTHQLTFFQTSDGRCSFISVERVQPHRDLRFSPVVVEHDHMVVPTSQDPENQGVRVRLYYHEDAGRQVRAHVSAVCSDDMGYAWTAPGPGKSPLAIQGDYFDHAVPVLTTSDDPPLTLRPLFLSGSSSNRIDLVFFSDGYTKDESEKFFDDARRLAQNISQNQTFAPVSPLLNFWAAFSPSKESGIGLMGKPRNTTFGLYRDGSELRGVFCSKLKIARAAARSLGSQCDYPILLGNDPLYGGLGGEFTISTSSILNGPLVLRHELGHSIIGAADEYDGAERYDGPNAQHSLKRIKWGHWLDGEAGTPRIERATMPLQVYPWILLHDATPAFRSHFDSSGTFNRFLIMFSVSGPSLSSDLTVLLDGEDLAFNPRSDVGNDRWHYEIPSAKDRALAGGFHELVFLMGPTARPGQIQVCSVEILECGSESEFNATPDAISLYPTYSYRNETSFRPTNHACLMRRVTNTDFCPPCLEGLWLHLFKRVDLIDRAFLSCKVNDVGGQRGTTIELDLLPLAQFRVSGPLGSESYELEWLKNGTTLPQFANSTSLILEGAGEYEVTVRFHTQSVRKDAKGRLVSRRAFTVTNDGEGCPIISKQLDLRPSRV